MAENDFRNSNRHHGRRTRNTPRDAHSDGVNSHASEPARRGGKNIHHDKEENPHKERATKMSKRATRVISGVAASIAFIFTLTGSTFGFESRNLRPTDNRANARTEVFSTAFDFAKRGADFNRPELRSRGRAGSNFDQPRDDLFALRVGVRNGWRSSATFNFRVRESDFNSRLDGRPDFASRPIDTERPDERLDDRRNDSRGEFYFQAERGLRSGNDSDFSRDAKADRDRDVA
jgi:hypothetical protein